MTIEQAAFFFVGTILVMLGLITLTAGAVVINNIISRYWKPVRIFWPIHSVEEYRNEYTQQPSGSKKDRAGTAGDKQQPDKV
jgi:hypothetical protein